MANCEVALSIDTNKRHLIARLDTAAGLETSVAAGWCNAALSVQRGVALRSSTGRPYAGWQSAP
jgi:hypothetical protein